MGAGREQCVKDVDFFRHVLCEATGEMCQPYLRCLVLVESLHRNDVFDAGDACGRITSERGDRGIDQSDTELDSELEYEFV